MAGIIPVDALAHRHDCWIVAFFPARGLRRPGWWSALLHPAYRHVVAFRGATTGSVIVNQEGVTLQADFAPYPPDFIARRLAEEAGAVMLAVWDERQRAEPRGALRGPMTCVETVKALLGIRKPFLLTPRQLARHLARAGAPRVLITAPEPVS
jgi:hypothetical protein